MPTPTSKRVARGLLAALIPALVLASPSRASEKLGLLDGDPNLAKASSHLLRARGLALDGLPASGFLAATPILRSTNGLPRVEVRLDRLDPRILDQLMAAGLAITSVSLRHARVYGLLDPERLDQVAALPEVSTIHPDYGAIAWTQGSVVSQGDASIDADDARADFSLDGSGVLVGILSDSFNNTLGGTVDTTAPSACDHTVSGMANQVSLDLPSPAGLHTDLASGGSDEGAAMGEIVRDLAPGADLLFRTGFVNEADFAAGIDDLVACGADVIVDDILYFAEPMFQDGPVAQAAEAAVAAGVPYFSAAGNSGSFGVDDTYTDSNGAVDDVLTFPSGSDLHDFDETAGLDSFATLTLPDDCGIRAVLQWSEPFDGTLGAGATSDLDLYLFSAAAAAPGNTLTSSTTFTGCGQLSCPDPENPSGPNCVGGDPFEIVVYTNTTGGPQTVHLAIEHFCGSENLQLRLATLGSSCSITDLTFDDASIFDDAQIYGHAAAENVIGVAAAFFDEIDTEKAGGDASEIDVEGFSSLGGTLPFYFDDTGGPLGPGSAPSPGAPPPAPATRFKPDLTAPDGGNNTFFGADVPEDPDSHENFFGTSAAAPHAAAVAALLLDATGESITPFAVSEILRQTTIDIETVDFTTGPDPASGEGLIRADLAAGAVAGATPATNCAEIAPPDLVLEGQVIAGTPPSPVVLRACDTLTVGAGEFTGADGRSARIIFTDGFESGDASAWSNTVP